MRRIVALLTALVLMAATLPGCGDRPPAADTVAAARPITIDYAESPAEAATRLADALLAATTLEGIRPAAYEALARTGVAVTTAAGDVLAPAGSRAVSLWLFEQQADNLSLDFIEHQGWTLETFTQAVATAPEGPGAGLLEQPQALGMMLREWAAVAAEVPDDPNAFAPLLLAALARARGGSADFTTGEIAPSQIELSYLEIMILTAGAFEAPPGGQSMAPSSGGHAAAAAGGRPVSFPLSLLAAEPAYAAESNPCSWIQEKWGKTAGDLAEEGTQSLLDKALEKVGDWLSGKGEAQLAGDMKLAGAAFKWANWLTSLIAMYGGYSLTVTWDPSPTHWLGYDGGHGNVKLTVTANVSTRPAGDQATLDCLKYAGIDKPSQETVKDCEVSWQALSGLPKHGRITSTDLTGQKVSEEGKATLEIEMTTEKSTEAGKTGRLKQDTIAIQCNLVTYKSDPGKLAAATIFGGKLGGSLEAGKAWMADWFPKRAVARIPVEWHELPRWKGVIDNGDGTSWVLLSGDGVKSIWNATLEGGTMQAGPATFKASGKGAFNLTSGSASTMFVKNMTSTIAGVAVNMDQTIELQITASGTDDAPTLEIDSSGGSTVVGAMGQSKATGIEAGGATTVVLEEVPPE